MPKNRYLGPLVHGRARIGSNKTGYVKASLIRQPNDGILVVPAPLDVDRNDMKNVMKDFIKNYDQEHHFLKK